MCTIRCLQGQKAIFFYIPGVWLPPSLLYPISVLLRNYYPTVCFTPGMYLYFLCASPQTLYLPLHQSVMQFHILKEHSPVACFKSAISHVD